MYRIGVLLVLSTLIPSCELLEDCKSCTAVLETSSGDKTYGATETYCGAQLAAKEIASEIINGDTSYYECE